MANETIHYVTKPIPAAKPPVDHVVRPWGSFEQYAHNQEVTVSFMTVNAGQRLSLQSHTGRAELWIVLDDGAEVQIDDAILRPRQGTNSGSQPMPGTGSPAWDRPCVCWKSPLGTGSRRISNGMKTITRGLKGKRETITP